MTPQDEMIARIEEEARLTARWTGRVTLAPAVLAALRKVPREAFVAPGDDARAYVDAPLPIGHGQTISQPFIVALMTDLLELKRTDRVLEVGTGSGYQAAVLAELADMVSSIEVIPPLAQRAAQVLRDQGYGRIALRTGRRRATAGRSGRRSTPSSSPRRRASVPPALVEQLASGGRMVIPVGEPGGEQELRLLTKTVNGGASERTILPVAFVPLTGEQAG